MVERHLAKVDTAVQFRSLAPYKNIRKRVFLFFLLSLPAVLGATLLKVVKTVSDGGIDTTLLPKYLIGMVVAGVVGYFSIRLVQLLANKGKFGKFSIYCWIAGIAALIASIVIR